MISRGKFKFLRKTYQNKRAENAWNRLSAQEKRERSERLVEQIMRSASIENRIPRRILEGGAK